MNSPEKLRDWIVGVFTANDNIDDVMITSSDVHVGLELGRLIQQSRAQRKMSQKDLAAVSHSFFVTFHFLLRGLFVYDISNRPISLCYNVCTEDQ